MSNVDHPLGWAALEQDRLNPDDARRDAISRVADLETAKLFFRVFSMGDGPALLQHLREQLIETPIYEIDGALNLWGELKIPLEPRDWSMLRTGQNSVFHHIIAMMAKAVEEPPLAATEKGNEDG